MHPSMAAVSCKYSSICLPSSLEIGSLQVDGKSFIILLNICWFELIIFNCPFQKYSGSNLQVGFQERETLPIKTHMNVYQSTGDTKMEDQDTNCLHGRGAQRTDLKRIPEAQLHYLNSFLTWDKSSYLQIPWVHQTKVLVNLLEQCQAHSR